MTDYTFYSRLFDIFTRFFIPLSTEIILHSSEKNTTLVDFLFRFPSLSVYLCRNYFDK